MTTTTPTPEALRHRDAARSWARCGEWGFTVASSAVNVTVVAAAGGSLLRILLAGLAPIVLAAMAHLLTKVLQSELVVSGVHWGVAMAVAGAVALIGAGAFTLSFDMLRRAAEPDHGELAWIFPATLDLAIVVCAGVLAVIAWADEQDQRTTAVQPVHESEQPTVHHAPDTAMHQGAPVPEHPAEELVDDVEQSAHQPDQTPPEPPVRVGAPAVTSGDEAVQPLEQTMHQEPDTQLVQPVERPRLVAVHRADAPGSVRRSKPAAPVQQRTTDAPEQSSDDAPQVQPVHTAQAEAVVQAGGIELPVERVAEVFARKDAGQSQNVIANAKVANKRTIAKLLAAREATAEPTDVDDPDRASVMA